MKSALMFDKLKALLKCTSCGKDNPDPNTKLCRDCEINKLEEEQDDDDPR